LAALLQALPADGLLVALDKDASTMAVAQRYWEKAGVAHKVRLRGVIWLVVLRGLLLRTMSALSCGGMECVCMTNCWEGVQSQTGPSGGFVITCW